MSLLLRRQVTALLVVVFVSAAPAPALAEDARPLWVAVTTASLEPALKPLAEKRAADGFDAVVSTKPVAQTLKELPRRPSFILIVGDYEPGRPKEPWSVSPKRLRAYRWSHSQPSEYASDAAWGDLDGDLVPDVPVGRIPARTLAEAEATIAKIIARENIGPDLRDLRFIAWTGAPGYGPLIDSLSSAALLGQVQAALPQYCEPVFLGGNPESPFCGWPPDQPAIFNQNLKRGAFLSVMMGHGRREFFLSCAATEPQIGYSIQDVISGLSAGSPACPAVIFACYTGDFTGPEACLAEVLLRVPAGPVAVIAAATESHPLANYYTGVSLLGAMNGADRRIGPMWLAAQRAARDASDPVVDRLLSDVAGKLEPQINIAKIKRDQMLLYELFGDPATPVFIPDALDATVERRGDRWHWQAAVPQGATRLSVGFRAETPALPAQNLSTRPDRMRATLKSANDAFAYEPLPSPEPGAPWQGDVDKPGLLRLVATGPGIFRVAVLQLRLQPQPDKLSK